MPLSFQAGWGNACRQLLLHIRLGLCRSHQLRVICCSLSPPSLEFGGVSPPTSSFHWACTAVSQRCNSVGLHGDRNWRAVLWRAHTKPHATCKTDRVLILASVVPLSLLFSWEWVFIFWSDFWLCVWSVVSICLYCVWLWLRRNPGDLEDFSFGLVREVEGGLRTGSLMGSLESDCPSPPCSAITHSPPGFLLSFCATYAMPLRTVLERSRLTCGLPALYISSLLPCFCLPLLWQKTFSPSLTSFQVNFSL